MVAGQGSEQQQRQVEGQATNAAVGVGQQRTALLHGGVQVAPHACMHFGQYIGGGGGGRRGGGGGRGGGSSTTSDSGGSSGGSSNVFHRRQAEQQKRQPFAQPVGLSLRVSSVHVGQRRWKRRWDTTAAAGTSVVGVVAQTFAKDTGQTFRGTTSLVTLATLATLVSLLLPLPFVHPVLPVLKPKVAVDACGQAHVLPTQQFRNGHVRVAQHDVHRRLGVAFRWSGLGYDGIRLDMIDTVGIIGIIGIIDMDCYD